MNKIEPTKKDVEDYGSFTGKEVFGIVKDFRWKVYDYKGQRYEVSQFSDEVNHIARIYCECCGRPFLPSRIKIYLGLYTCLGCAKN